MHSSYVESAEPLVGDDSANSSDAMQDGWHDDHTLAEHSSFGATLTVGVTVMMRVMRAMGLHWAMERKARQREQGR